MYAQLGSIQFQGLYGYDEHEKELLSKFAEVDLIEGKPDLQHIGTALDVITIGVLLHEAFCDPPTRFAEFDTARLNGDVLPYLDGAGNLIGNFVIEKIEQSILQTDRKGIITVCRCRITLKEYVSPDRLQAKAAQANRDAFALGNAVQVTNIQSPPATVQGDVFKSIKGVSDSVSQTGDSINHAVADSNKAQVMMKKALQGVDDAKAAADDLQDKLERYGDEVASADDVMSSTLAVKDQLSALGASLAAGDLPNSSANYTLLSNAMTGLNTNTLQLQKLLILR